MSFGDVGDGRIGALRRLHERGIEEGRGVEAGEVVVMRCRGVAPGRGRGGGEHIGGRRRHKDRDGARRRQRRAGSEHARRRGGGRRKTPTERDRLEGLLGRLQDDNSGCFCGALSRDV